MGTKIRVIYEKTSYLFCFLWYFFIFLSQNAKFKVGGGKIQKSIGTLMT